MKKAIYIGYDIFSGVLEHLLGAGVEVVELYTLEAEDPWNKRGVVEDLALKAGSKIFRHGPTSKSLQAAVDHYNIDHIIVAAAPYVVPLTLGPRIINFHPSLLPKGRGRWPIPYFLLGKESTFGVTIHELTNEMDAGPVIIQKKLPVVEDDNYETLVAKCVIGFREILDSYLREADLLWSNRKEQDEGEVFPFPSDAMQTLCFDDGVTEIKKKLRAFSRNEVGAEWESNKWLVASASAVEFPHDYKPGTVITQFQGNVVLAASDGICVVHQWRPDDE